MKEKLKHLIFYIRTFITKVIEVIISSRRGEKLNSECNPENSKEWFYLSLPSNKTLSQELKSIFMNEYILNKNLRIILEISCFINDKTQCTELWEFAVNDTVVPQNFIFDKNKRTNIFMKMSTILHSLLCITRALPTYNYVNYAQNIPKIDVRLLQANEADQLTSNQKFQHKFLFPPLNCFIYELNLILHYNDAYFYNKNNEQPSLTLGKEISETSNKSNSSLKVQPCIIGSNIKEVETTENNRCCLFEDFLTFEDELFSNSQANMDFIKEEMANMSSLEASYFPKLTLNESFEIIHPCEYATDSKIAATADFVKQNHDILNSNQRELLSEEALSLSKIVLTDKIYPDTSTEIKCMETYIQDLKKWEKHFLL